jgi:hypothetical protein
VAKNERREFLAYGFSPISRLFSPILAFLAYFSPVSPAQLFAVFQEGK